MKEKNEGIRGYIYITGNVYIVQSKTWKAGSLTKPN